MSSATEHWYHKLDKIQFALAYVRSIQDGRQVEAIIRKLEELEERATKDLIEAENDDQR